ncbi:hypothetical protein JW824_05035 [bacterium]|nr:hypothetical protein [bacterium]
MGLFLQFSCKNGDDTVSGPNGPTGPITFTHAPVDTSKIAQATPLGNLNPPGHTFLTDHIYFYLNDPNLVEVREALPEKNSRTVEPSGGKIDFDIDGALSGNRFLEGTPINGATSIDYAANHLAFVYDMFDPSQIRIAAGGTLNLSPLNHRVGGNTPDPVTVTTASGMVKYELMTTPTAVLQVEMQDTRTIRVEVFPDKTKNEVSNFTTSAETYVS